MLTHFQLSLSTVHFFNYIFNPTFGFVHILPKFGFSIFYSVAELVN